MSSEAVRTALLAAVTPLASPWPVYDLSDYLTIEQVMDTVQTEAVLLQYVVADDELITIGGQGNQGWEETGTVTIHLVVPTGFPSDTVVEKGDDIRVGLRGYRIAPDTVVESCSPFVDFGAGGIGVNGALHGWASQLFYSRRDCG